MLDPTREQSLNRIASGMDVSDVGGDKVGSVAHVYRSDGSAPDLATADGAPNAATTAAVDGFIEVKSGLFGLGSHYYVPMSAVQELVGDGIFLSEAKERFDELGWTQKPSHLGELQSS